MSKLSWIVSLTVGVALMALAAPLALAFAQTEGTAANPPSATYQVTQKTVNLSPIVVQGQRFSLPVALQLYKKALTRPWSSSREDLDKLVCQWRAKAGTHMQTLFCQTNRDHLKLAEAIHVAALTSTSKYAGTGLRLAALIESVPVVLSNFTTRRSIKRSTFAPILKKLPPADGSYTLRVTDDDGKPLFDYVIKNGELVHINQYVYKDGKATGANE